METDETHTKFQTDVLAYLHLPKCEVCKMPTPDEFADCYYWEAGARVCDACKRGMRKANPRKDPRRGRSRRRKVVST